MVEPLEDGGLVPDTEVEGGQGVGLEVVANLGSQGPALLEAVGMDLPVLGDERGQPPARQRHVRWSAARTSPS